MHSYARELNTLTQNLELFTCFCSEKDTVKGRLAGKYEWIMFGQSDR